MRPAVVPTAGRMWCVLDLAVAEAIIAPGLF